ncbi:hypothetical protein H257_18907, partial [Aphanomyces astaci]
MRRRTQYPISTKLEAIGLLESMSCHEVARVLKVPRRTVRSWLTQRSELLAYDGNKKNNKLEPCGRYETLQIKVNQREWLLNYLATKKPDAAYNSLLKLLQRFCKRHGFSRQLRGGSSKISAGEKHSMRMTAVLTVRADGTKLPLMFIMRGTPGGRIESSEFPTFPSEHYYAVQTKAWMCQYLREVLGVLGESIEEPSVVHMDNCECHVSAASYKIMYEELVMAPFKRNLRNLWLLEEHIIGDDEDPYSLTAQQKRMAMMQRTISAWDMVSEDV